MGNTIRREPVNFSIPASPDYKFLNITNFRGLDISSNPFELATNTASDCLNVYVDETNTLTTRPRLEKKELKDNSNNDILPLNGTCVGVYPLHDGYLFHYTQQMKILHGDNLTEILAESIPQKACKHFEQGDKIFLLGDGRYMVIDENAVLKDVEGYVPIRSIVRVDGTLEKTEPINILSDTHKDLYYWTFEQPMDFSNALQIENTTFEQSSKGIFKSDSKFKIEIETVNGSRHSVVYFDNTKIVDLTENVGDGFWYDYSCVVRKNNNSFWILDPINAKVCVVYSYGDSWKYSTVQIPTTFSMSPMFLNNSVNKNGDQFVWCNDAGTEINVYELNKESETLEIKTTMNATNLTTHNAFFVDNLVVADYQYDGFRMFPSLKWDEAIIAQGVHYVTQYIGVHDGKIYTLTKDGTINSHDITTGEIIKQQNIDFNPIHIRFIEGSKASLWYLSNDLELWTIPNENDINKNHAKTGLRFSDAHNIYNESYVDLEFIYLRYSGETGSIVTEISYTLNTTTPTVTVTRQSKVVNRRELLMSMLFTRFDNNYWFASGNTYFRSLYNDPTYFPITEYHELGDSNEDITGFNIANDTTLLAYKENRLFLIQPFYSETTGMTEYSITESKNTVGNTAIDAPIITTLTEIPLQINNDGVYGLSQVSNVSAVERIADLMSEPINDRWLNEDDEVIKKAQTLNRLYWTYIILPYEKLTKVYLLDNRTNSWYYWELPITLLNAFAKDNHAEFVDTDGNIYYLTTTDIRNMGFDTQLVTEYYDYGKKLIPWLWQSQVMYLGTMNHAKRLVNTTFILTDTDTQDGYGLQYSFKVFRKLASSVPEKELSGDLNLVRSTTKKTNISKFGFLQLKLSNITEDSQGTEAEKAYRNNKLRLVGLGLKYVLLEGLIR